MKLDEATAYRIALLGLTDRLRGQPDDSEALMQRVRDGDRAHWTAERLIAEADAAGQDAALRAVHILEYEIDKSKVATDSIRATLAKCKEYAATARQEYADAADADARATSIGKLAAFERMAAELDRLIGQVERATETGRERMIRETGARREAT